MVDSRQIMETGVHLWTLSPSLCIVSSFTKDSGGRQQPCGPGGLSDFISHFFYCLAIISLGSPSFPTPTCAPFADVSLELGARLGAGQ